MSNLNTPAFFSSHMNLCSKSLFQCVAAVLFCWSFPVSHRSLGSLDAQHPISLLSYCLSGLRGDLSHHTRPNLFWIVANVAIFVLLEVNFSHEHQIQSNILKAAIWCQAPKLCHRQDLPQLGPRLHQGSVHSI